MKGGGDYQKGYPSALEGLFCQVEMATRIIGTNKTERWRRAVPKLTSARALNVAKIEMNTRQARSKGFSLIPFLDLTN
jgi:hypothetical protein